jgi:two-component system C4-dicarboxylate transport sensor histidine kinase DctB
MPNGGTLAIRLRTEGGSVTVEVEDEGEGIPAAIADKVFEPFFTTRTEAEGMGLGLAYCKRLVEALGGSIAFAGKAKGTVFRVTVPIEGAP